ncbi:hypothetical protein [Agrobacterium larrymoorei]|uniref:Uncharacterized protein n=1 Tax=Agrobacterium larrymoorei TaxID=160699 RepID=A0AAF0KFY6_9HYPH|nr:hypothetical protein [Agrobacterium larrymoorei]WHA43990.1 hypothetical protein CFBP5477_023000 [Agrobacterium larrymoorei]
MIQQQPRPLLCLAGSLIEIDLPPLVAALEKEEALDVSVRSTGGPVEVWLEIGEHLFGRLYDLHIDEACFSSCANYLVPFARTVIAEKNALVAWHGGPNMATDEALTGSGVSDAITYHSLAARTLKLYDAAGIDSRVLAFTGMPPSPKKLKSVLKGGTPVQSISGYALSPKRLTTCFGFKNLGRMWHPGDDADVFALGRKRSDSLNLLESPLSKGEKNAFCSQ